MGLFAAVFALAKQFPTFIRNQERHAWERVRGGIVLEGKTCGIVGLGAIGRETAKRARAIGMRVVGCRRTVDGDDPDCDAMVSYADLPGLLSQSDFVVLCVPLTRETTHLIDAAAGSNAGHESVATDGGGDHHLPQNLATPRQYQGIGRLSVQSDRGQMLAVHLPRGRRGAERVRVRRRARSTPTPRVGPAGR
jgi:hypothetical protein